MEYKTAKEIRKAINDNLDSIKSLMDNAKAMQDAIAEQNSPEVKRIMTENFNHVVDSINMLLKTTKTLFDYLDDLLEE